mmetsp:Transcript_58172/g.142233  ORF Transcript_58172/g.142233 Transcript_58172/m.142233 type:complete len:322 (-) Transcript_58172:1941-2906(-)
MSTKKDKEEDDEKKPPPYQHQKKQPPPTTYSSSQQQQKKPPPPTSSETMMDTLQFPLRDDHDNVAVAAAAAPPFAFHGSSFKTSDDNRVAISSSQNHHQDQKASTASNDGSVSSSYELQSQQQEQEQSLEGVSSKDVLCGRDRVSHAHIGNKKFRKLIEELRQSYQNAPSRDIKTQITCQVISTIHNEGGRFLKLVNEKQFGSGEQPRWEEVSDQYAREKVSHALRSAKDPHRPKVKKRRQMKEYVPTPEEESLFQDTFADQQQIFRSMIARCEKRRQQQSQNKSGDEIDASDDGYQNDQDQSNGNDNDMDGQYDDFEFFS